MKKRQIIIVLGLLGILTFSYFLMQFLIAQRQELPRRAPEVGDRWVKTEKVKYTTVPTIVIGKGRVVSTAEVEVIAEAAGKVEEGSVPLKKGQSFKKGDTLLTIYKDEAELALKAQKSQFLNRVANLLPDIRIDFPQQFDEFAAFFNAINLDNDFPELPEIQTEQMKIFLASRNVLNDYYSIKRAEKQLSRHTITAPFNGAFAQVQLQVGAFTGIGGRIASIIRTDELEVEVSVFNNEAEFIKIGSPVEVVSDQRDLTWRGTVVRISDFVLATTQQRSVFVKVPVSGQPPLYAGEYMIAAFKGMTITDAMEIPRSAVDNTDEVFIVKDGRLKKQEVEILKVNEKTTIFRGLPEGADVVVQKLINVAENSPVKILGVDDAGETSSSSARTAQN